MGTRKFLIEDKRHVIHPDRRRQQQFALCVSAWFALSMIAPACGLARCEDTNVAINQETFGNGIRFMAQIENATEVTIDFDCRSYKNAIPSSKLPASFALPGPRKVEILRFKQHVMNQEWLVGPCTHHWRYGFPSKVKTDQNFVYRLPFESGNRFEVTQSYQGPHSHNQGSESEFAIDFKMPLGTRICAAREGVVIAIRDDSTVGGADKNLERCANFVIVRHSDGTYANYVHLNPHSVVVKLGQKVQAGTALAQSGETGWTTTPHLHFDVYRVQNGQHRATLPVRLRTSDGILDRLYAGNFYGSSSQ